jgi:hypothetical protein
MCLSVQLKYSKLLRTNRILERKGKFYDSASLISLHWLFINSINEKLRRTNEWRVGQNDGEKYLMLLKLSEMN